MSTSIAQRQKLKVRERNFWEAFSDGFWEAFGDGFELASFDFDRGFAKIIKAYYEWSRRDGGIHIPLPQHERTFLRALYRDDEVLGDETDPEGFLFGVTSYAYYEELRAHEEALAA